MQGDIASLKQNYVHCLAPLQQNTLTEEKRIMS